MSVRVLVLFGETHFEFASEILVVQSTLLLFLELRFQNIDAILVREDAYLETDVFVEGIPGAYSFAL